MLPKSGYSKLYIIITMVMIFIAAGTYAYGYIISGESAAITDQIRKITNEGSASPLIDETANGASPAPPAEIDSYETKSRALATESTSTSGGMTPTTFENGGTHPEGNANSPYTYGVDGYGYTNPEDYKNSP